MRAAIDTNVLAYAEGVNATQHRAAARHLVARLPQDAGAIPVQALGELFNVLVRKAGRPRDEARDALLIWSDMFPVIGTSPGVMVMAADLAAQHRLPIWDAVILPAASSAGCRLLLSEDLQGGFTWGGVTVINPFAEARHPFLDALLGE